MSEVIFVITSAVKDVCGKPPTEHLFLDKYERICLCLDEIVWKVGYELNHFKISNTREIMEILWMNLAVCSSWTIISNHQCTNY